MKLLISFLFIIIFNSNLYASENSIDNFIKKSNENTQKTTPKLSDEQLQELIKKLPRENSVIQSKSSEDWFKKLRPFILPLIIILILIFRTANNTEDESKKNTKKKRSRTQEFIEKHNEDNKKQRN